MLFNRGHIMYDLLFGTAVNHAEFILNSYGLFQSTIDIIQIIQKKNKVVNIGVNTLYWEENAVTG